MIIHKNNITLTMINSHVNYFELVRMIQTKIGIQQNFKHLIQVRFYFQSREPLKIHKALKFIIFNSFMLGVNKRAYIRKQTSSWNLQVWLSVYEVLVPTCVKMG